MSQPRWLVLGAGSWLGHLLLLQEGNASTPHHGTIHRQIPPGLPPSIILHRTETVAQYLAAAHEAKPDIVANFLRGEDEEGFAIHVAMAEFCRNHGILYVYLSSVLALDGYAGHLLSEDLPPRSVSPYGQFKARCEEHLSAQAGDWLVARLASAQGWCPHKPTRNEKFLAKVATGEAVSVDIGVVQNRLPADWLVEAIRAMAHRRMTGTVHLGAIDASEEIDFLRRVANAFGWDEKLVVPGVPRPVNLDCRPARIFQLFGDRFRRTETDTLKFLRCHPGLQRWHNPRRP